MLPPPLLARAKTARVILEVGAGARFETALALHEASPDARVFVTDVDARVLDAPAPLEARVLDVHAPEGAPAADLVVAVRAPEELQGAIVRLGARLGADVALRALKDEWADVPGRVPVVWPGGWRYYARR